MGGLLRNPVTGNLYRNAGGGLIFNGLAAAQECCCGEDPVNDVSLMEAIYERQKAANRPSGELIDPYTGPYYTLAELCAFANNFCANQYWILDRDWNGGGTATPVTTRSANYFGVVGSGKTVEVADEDELFVEVVKFARSTLPNLPTYMGLALGYAKGGQDDNVPDQTMDDAIQSAKDNFANGGGATYGVHTHVYYYLNNRASAYACMPCLIQPTSGASVDTRNGRTISLWAKPAVATNTAGGFGVQQRDWSGHGVSGLSAGVYCKVAGAYVDAGNDNYAPAETYSGYSGAPSSWPSSTLPSGYVGVSLGFQLASFFYLCDWDFVYL
jgi:hypothetical protein